MILLDANVLIYAYDAGSPYHATAKRWMEQAMARREELALDWTVILAFLRIMTNPLAFRAGFTVEDCVEVMDSILFQSNVTVLQPAEEHWSVLRRMIVSGQATRNFVMDAHLAALTIELGASLCTNDRDFLRFKGLKLVNPVSKQ